MDAGSAEEWILKQKDFVAGIKCILHVSNHGLKWASMNCSPVIDLASIFPPKFGVVFPGAALIFGWVNVHIRRPAPSWASLAPLTRA